MKRKDRKFMESSRQENLLTAARKIIPELPFYFDGLGRVAPSLNLLVAALEMEKRGADYDHCKEKEGRER